MKDKYGLYVEANGDGGDCSHRCGIVLCGQVMKNQDTVELTTAIATHLEVSPNEYVRYPTQYNQPNDFSRDQASRLMLGLGMAGKLEKVKGYYKILFKNKLRHPNGDYIGTGEPGNIVRILSLWYLYPVLCFLDLKFFGDLISRKINPWGYDALYLPDLQYATHKYPTIPAILTSMMVRDFFLEDVTSQISLNMLDPNNNPCVEAGIAMMSILAVLI